MPTNSEIAYRYLIARGLQPWQAAGVVGNLMEESGLNPNAINPGDGTDGSDSIGIGQWNGPRAAALRAYAHERGRPVNDFTLQMDFMWNELTTRESYAYNQLIRANNVQEATAAFLHYERPAGYSQENPTGAHSYMNRVNHATGLFAGAGGDVQVGTLPPIPGAQVADNNNGVTVNQPLTVTPFGRQPGQPQPAPFTPRNVSVPTSDLFRQASQQPPRYSDAIGQLRNPTPVDIREAEIAAARDRLPVSGGRLIGAAVESTWLTSQLFTGDGAFAEDPNFLLSKDRLDQLTDGIDRQYWEMFSNARSDAHAEWLRGHALRQMENERLLGEAGFGGAALAFAAALLDPAAIAAGIASGGLAAITAKARGLGRLGTRLLSSAYVGAAEGGYGIAQMLAGNRHYGAGDVVFGAALGAAAGFAFAPMSAATAAERAALSRISRGIADEEAAEIAGETPGAVGAARLEPDTDLTPEQIRRAVNQQDTPETALGGARFDLAAYLAGATNRAVRMAAGLVQDAVGKKNGAVNGIAASEEASRFYRTWMAEWASAWRPAYNQWAKDRGFDGWRRLQRNANLRQQFNEEVNAFLRTRDPTVKAQYHPSVAQVASKWTAMAREIGEDLKNPWRHEGQVGRPVLDELVDENYIPHVIDGQRVNAAIEIFGEANVREWIAGSVRRANPDLADDIIERLAAGYLRNVRRRYYGIDDDVTRAFMGGDKDALRRMLMDDTELSAEEVDAIMDALNRPRPGVDAGKDSRARHRVLFDEAFTLKNLRHSVHGTAVDGELSFSSLFITDMNTLAVRYMHWAAGRKALARYTVKDKDGNILINGFTKDSEWDDYIRQVRRTAADERPYKGGVRGDEKQQLDADVERLNFVYNYILGRPPPQDMKQYAQWLRLARKFNLARIGGQFGWAQANEFANIVSQVGLKSAMQHMSVVRRIINANGDYVLKNNLARELESITGLSSMRQTALLEERFFDTLGNAEFRSGGLVQRANDVLEQAGRGVMDLSMMRPITTFQNTVALRAIAQRFSDMASTGNPSKAVRARMREIGLSDEQLEAVLAQVKKHRTLENGILFRERLNMLNLDKWDDLTARSAFENAVYRYTRRVIQENDIGQLAKWMSNPIAQAILQFRNFMIGAYTKALLHNVKMRDWESFVYFSASTVWSAMTYAVWTKVKGIGRSDQQEYNEDRLSPSAIMRAGFARTGWASLVPMGVDTAGRFLGIDPLFEFRTSGQAQDAIFGNPTMDLLGDAAGAMGAFFQIFSPEGMAQTDLRKWARIMPFGNAMPFVQTYDALISGAPPRNRDNPNFLQQLLDNFTGD